MKLLRQLVGGVVVSLATLAVLLVVCEFGLRVSGIGEDALDQPHPWAGWTHIPSRVAQIHNEDKSLGPHARVVIDSLGLRDIERSVEKPPGTLRVLVVGDSYVEGVQVPAESVLTRAMERDMNVPNGRRVEVWNCGTAGYTTSQELLYLAHVADRFHPDAVVLCFLSGNDVADEVPALATSLRNRPFYRLTPDSLVLDRSFFKPDAGVVGWLRLHSQLFNWVSVQRRIAMMNLARRAEQKRRGSDLPPVYRIYEEQPDSLWSLGWTLTDKLIVATRDEAARQGARFLLVSISNGEQEHPKARERWPGWAEWEHKPGISLMLPEQRLAALSAAQGIDYLPLLPAFQEEQARTGAALHIGWTGHWNSAGHALAARTIAARLEPLIH